MREPHAPSPPPPSESVTAVIFVASLSEYDQTLAEARGVNRLAEAMELWAEIVNSNWFEHASIVLFLNKLDLFTDKLASVSLRAEAGADWPGSAARCLDYAGGRNVDEALAYLERKFLSLQRAPRTVFKHVTCATDTEGLRVVFRACTDAILRENIERAGL